MGRPTVAIINVVVSHDVFNSSYSDNFCRSPAFVCRGLLLPVDGYSGVQGGRGRGHGLLQPPPTCPGPTYPRPRPQQQPAPPRRATALGRGRPVPRRGNTAGANLRRLLGLGVCSCAPISGTCGTQHRGLLTTPSPGYRQETRREAAATESQSVTSGQCRSAESPSCHLPRYCRYSRHLYLHKSHHHTAPAEDAGLAARGPDGAAGAVIARGGGAGAGLHRPRALAHDGQVLGPPLAPRLRGRRGPQAGAAAPRAAQPVR